MRILPLAILSLLSSTAFTAPAPKTQSDGPYHVITTQKVGGDGGFDYVYADPIGRKLYIPRMGNPSRVTVFNLDTLQPLGEIPETSGHGASTDALFAHGFSSSKPVVMWDVNTLSPIKSIDVDGGPDGILGDPYNHHVYIFSHGAPNATVIDAKEGTVLGTIDLGGAPEEAATDGHGHLFVDLEDKGGVAVVDTNSMKVTATYSLGGKGAGDAGLALDPRNHVLYVACREPNTMVMLDSRTGNYLASLPIGQGCDGVVFNPRTHECFSSQGDGTLTIIKQTGPAAFVVEQTVQTTRGAKTLTLDPKTNKIFLIAAEYGPAPQPEQGDNGGGFRRRGPMVPGSFSIWVVGK